MPPEPTVSDLTGLWVVAGVGLGGRVSRRGDRDEKADTSAPCPRELHSVPVWTCDTLRAGGGRHSARSVFIQLSLKSGIRDIRSDAF